MKSKRTLPILLVLLALAIVVGCGQAIAQQTTAFTYQGQLHDGGTNASGVYTMIFKLFDAVTSGNQIGNALTNKPTLANGLFTVNLDFGAGAFNGSARWLDITVTNAGVTQTLSPRVQVLPAPYSLYAATAGSATTTATATLANSVAANSITTASLQDNAVTTAKIASGAVTNRNLTVNAVGTLNIQTNAITTAQIASSAVVTTNIANGSVTDVKIVSVSGSKVSGGVALATNANFATSASSATSAVNLTNGSWNTSVGTVQLYGLTLSNIFGIYAGTSPVIMMSTNGPFVPNNFHVGATLAVGNSATDIGTIYYNTVNGLVLGNSVSGYAATINGDLLARSYNYISDQNLKEKFAPIDKQEILERVASLPISSWNFKTDAGTRHIGPMAQDFYTAFNVGTDDKHIAIVDEGGVALAAIQGLNEKLKAKDAELQRLRLRQESLETRLAELEQLVRALTLK